MINIWIDGSSSYKTDKAGYSMLVQCDYFLLLEEKLKVNVTIADIRYGVERIIKRYKIDYRTILNNTERKIYNHYKNIQKSSTKSERLKLRDLIDTETARMVNYSIKPRVTVEEFSGKNKIVGEIYREHGENCDNRKFIEHYAFERAVDFLVKHKKMFMNQKICINTDLISIAQHYEILKESILLTPHVCGNNLAKNETYRIILKIINNGLALNNVSLQYIPSKKNLADDGSREYMHKFKIEEYLDIVEYRKNLYNNKRNYFYSNNMNFIWNNLTNYTYSKSNTNIAKRIFSGVKKRAVIASFKQMANNDCKMQLYFYDKDKRLHTLEDKDIKNATEIEILENVSKYLKIHSSYLCVLVDKKYKNICDIFYSKIEIPKDFITIVRDIENDINKTKYFFFHNPTFIAPRDQNGGRRLKKIEPLIKQEKEIKKTENNIITSKNQKQKMHYFGKLVGLYIAKYIIENNKLANAEEKHKITNKLKMKYL